MISCQHNIKMAVIYTIWETKASWKLNVGLAPQTSDLLYLCLGPAVDSDLSTISARVPDCKMSTTRASSEAGHLWQACFIWLHGRIRLRANWIILLWVTSWLRIEAGPWEMRPGSWKTLSRITAASLTFLKSSITGGRGILQRDSSMAGSSCQPVNGWRQVAGQLKYSKRLTSIGSTLFKPSGFSS